MIRNFSFKKEYVDTRENIIIKLLEKYGTLLRSYTSLQRSPYLNLNDIRKYFVRFCHISIGYNQNIITDDFINSRQLPDVLDYKCVYESVELNSDNVEQCLLSSYRTFKNPTFTSDFINKYVGDYFDDWEYISFNPNLTPEFIEKYKNKLNWSFLSENPALTLSLIYLYIHKISWIGVSNNINIDETFITKYIDRLNMSRLSRNPAFTMMLVEKFKDRVCWRTLSYNPSLTTSYIDKYIDMFVDNDNLIMNPNINTLDLFDKYIVKSQVNTVDWNSLIFNKFLYDDTVFSREITRDIIKRRLYIEQNIDIVHDIKNYILKYYIGYN